MRTIQPGQSLTYRFTVTRSGIWMYHCASMPMSLHIAGSSDLMLTGGEALENYANRRAKRELDALLTRAPQRWNWHRRSIRGRVLGREARDWPVHENVLLFMAKSVERCSSMMLATTSDFRQDQDP